MGIVEKVNKKLLNKGFSWDDIDVLWKEMKGFYEFHDMERKGTKVISEVIDERLSQDTKWGEQNHRPMEWLSILGEEVGEVNKACLETYFNYPENGGYTEMRKEVIQVAAVAVAIVESLDRNELKYHSNPKE
ncbi:hypothetical protein [Leptobacterium sp. I13]|uniref:hypothetical protein n=1 Tax=Leptobacterium meishanense TaxID=3128904 RepID=UPI0030EF55B6